MWTSAKSRRTPARRPDSVLAGSYNTASSSKGRDMRGEPVCYPLPCSTATNKTPRSPGSKHPSSPPGSCLQLGDREWRQLVLSDSPLSQGQLPGDFLWCGDKGLRKGRASACHSCSPPPCPHKGLQVTTAHIQRDLHLWEKNYLHLFRFIYIHSWILIQKEKN